jgi:hypothetical protein
MKTHEANSLGHLNPSDTGIIGAGVLVLGKADTAPNALAASV